MEKMNLYRKLAKIRAETTVSKTGFNKFGKYHYYEIDNIYTEAKKLFDKYGIFTTFTLEYSNETSMYLGILDVYDCDSSETIKTRIDSPTNEMKGASACQQVGSNVTYQCKYLYMSLLMLDDGANDPDFKNTHNKEKGEGNKTQHNTTRNTPTPIANGDDDDFF